MQPSSPSCCSSWPAGWPATLSPIAGRQPVPVTFGSRAVLFRAGMAELLQVKGLRGHLRSGTGALLSHSSMVTVPRPVTVAAGAFAPGHLGELTRYLPFELVDDMLEMAGAVQQRMRMLPSRVGVYFLLAMTLFPGLGYLRVWDKLTAALDGLGLPRPSEKALRDLRRRIGAAPVASRSLTSGDLSAPRYPATGRQ